MDEKKGLSGRALCAALGDARRYIRAELFDEVPSTNILAKERGLAGAPEGLLLAAAAQSAGRGRLGRHFASPEGGVYFSLLLRPDWPAERVRLLTPAAAVAVCRVADRLSGGHAQIKWVNDVIVPGGKAAGILTEAVTVGEERFIVVGIGLNVSPPEGGFPAELQGIAAPFFPAGAPDGTTRSTFCGLVCAELWSLYRDFDTARFVEEYRARSCVVGREVTVLRAGTSRPAAAFAIDDDCRLGVRYRDGSEEFLFGGEISIRL